MKIKLKEIINSIDVIRKIVQIPLPIKTLYQLDKIIKPIEEKIKKFDNIRLNLMQRYGTIQDGKFIIDKDEEFRAKINELLELEVELNIDKIPLNLIENIEMSYEDFSYITYLIDNNNFID